jgi:hypothetical protein
MTLHPKCPCSRASLHELAELTSRAEGRLDVHILFVQPTGAPPGWLDGDLWVLAKSVPHATIHVDKDGKDAAALGATTSGQVALYDRNGNLQFRGGITDGRGHEGDNTGYLAVLDYIRTGKSPTASTPVYGCSLGVCKAKLN